MDSGRGRQKCEDDRAPRASSSCTIGREERGKREATPWATTVYREQRKRKRESTESGWPYVNAPGLFQSAINDDTGCIMCLSRDSRTFLARLLCMNQHTRPRYVRYIPVFFLAPTKKTRHGYNGLIFFIIWDLRVTLVPDLAEANAVVFTVARRSGAEDDCPRGIARESFGNRSFGQACVRARLPLPFVPVVGNAFACFRDRKYSRENKKKKKRSTRCEQRGATPVLRSRTSTRLVTNKRKLGRKINKRA